MADYLKVFVDGETILASETNSNNQYLLGQITETTGAVAQELETELNNTKQQLNASFSELETSINESIEEINTKLDSIDYTPDYTNKVSISLNDSTKTLNIDWDGWLVVDWYANGTNNSIQSYINGCIVADGRGGSQGGIPATTNALVLVKNGDVYTWSQSGGVHSVWQLNYRGV